MENAMAYKLYFEFDIIIFINLLTLANPGVKMSQMKQVQLKLDLETTLNQT